MLTTNLNFLLTQNNVSLLKKKKKKILVQRYSYRGAVHILVREYGDEPYALDSPDKQTTLNHNKIICVL